MTNMTFIKPCSPHSWAHAPTVGYYACINCREAVMYDDPRYIEIEAEQAKQIAAIVLAAGATAMTDLTEQQLAEGRPEFGDYADDAQRLARKAYRARTRGTGMHLTPDEVVALHMLNGDDDWWLSFYTPETPNG